LNQLKTSAKGAKKANSTTKPAQAPKKKAQAPKKAVTPSSVKPVG